MKKKKLPLAAIKEEIAKVLEDRERTDYEQGYEDGFEDGQAHDRAHTLGHIDLNEKKKTTAGKMPDTKEETSIEDIKIDEPSIDEPSFQDLGANEGGGGSIEEIQKELLKIYRDAKGLKGTIADNELNKFLTQVKNTAIQFNKIAFLNT